ncbi:Uncharacterized protein NEOC65_001721 [Neochlamydia sp. AcF65]|nr:Uncharacterized protein [Neochlamydia sp. AcF65]
MVMHEMLQPCKKITKKGAHLALFLLVILSSCSTSMRQWKLKCNKASYRKFTGSRLYLPAENALSEVEVEIIKTSREQLIYLNAKGLEFQTERKDLAGHATLPVAIHVDEQEHYYSAFLLQGNQRILLPENACSLIISSLLDHKKVTIVVSNRSTLLTHEHFTAHYSKLTY